MHTKELKHGTKIQSVIAAVRRDIFAGRYSPGSELPSQNELARQYGVCINTAREAIGALVNERLVVRTHGKGTFVAARLPAASTIIHVVMENHRWPDQPQPAEVIQCLQGIMNACQDLQVTVRLSQWPIHELTAEKSEWSAPSSQGVILLMPATDRLLPDLESHHVPYVEIDHITHVPRPVPLVTYSRRETARIATRHMASLGYRYIAHLGSNHEDPREFLRAEGFLDVITEQGLTLPGGYLARCSKTFADIQAAILKMMALNPRPEAICCSTSRMAEQALIALREHGLRVPEDVALMCFTDSGDDANVPVPLSGMYLPFGEMGSMAVQVLRDILAGKQPKAGTVLLEPRLVIRESCGSKLNRRGNQ